MRIEEIDKNFAPAEIPKDVEMEYHNVRHAPFKIFGVFRENESDDYFTRVPEGVAKASGNVGVCNLRKHNAGGRVSFSTNSKYIAIRAKMHEITKKGDMSTESTAGFDLYEDNRFRGIFYPPYDYSEGYAAACCYTTEKKRRFIVNMPLYSAVSELEIGIVKGSTLEEYEPYCDTLPIVYYGSSITQGAMASRPGNAYQAKISRELGIDFINLGFSGSARGEAEIAEYIASLPMSVFVMDYDYNAPTAEHLLQTHEKFYKIMREKNPTLPIVFVTAPDVWHQKYLLKKRAVVMQTYANAIAAGDENVHFIDGQSFYQYVDPDFCTVDGCHPNDLGFYHMAMGMLHLLKEILKK